MRPNKVIYQNDQILSCFVVFDSYPRPYMALSSINAS